MELPQTLLAHPLGAALHAGLGFLEQGAQAGLRTSALLGARDKAAALQAISTAEAYLAAMKHTVVAEAIDQGAPGEFAGEATTPAQWLRSILHTTTHEGRALAETAQLLDRHPETIAMLAAGEGSLDHAKVMAKALDEIGHLPFVTREEHARAATTLRADTAMVNPVELGRVATALVEALTRTPSVDDPADEPDLADPAPDRWLRIDKHRDGTSDGRWRNLDPISTATLEALLADTHPKTGQPKTASAGASGHASAAATGGAFGLGAGTNPDSNPCTGTGMFGADRGDGTGTGAAFGLGSATADEGVADVGTGRVSAGDEAADEAVADRRTRGQRWLDTLAGVLRHAGDCDPTSPPAQSAVTLTVATEYDVLAKQLGEGTLDSDVPLDPGTVRRLACEAGILPVVMDGPSRILDLGRTQRLFTPAQRAALTLRDRGCTFPGCDQPAHRSIAHHRQHWEHGGPTDLDNAALLCLHHHIRIHREKWESRLSPVNGHVEWRPPRLIDPDRRWRQHIRYRIDRLIT